MSVNVNNHFPRFSKSNASAVGVTSNIEPCSVRTSKSLHTHSNVEVRIIDDEPSISDWLSLNQVRLDRL